MNRVIFVIPGFGQSAEDRDYLKFKKDLQKHYDKVFVLNVRWKRQVMTDYITFVDNEVQKLIDKSDQKILVDILGFSFGAMIAFVLSKKFNFRNIFLCSLSPYFKEHLTTLSKRQIRFLKKNRQKDFENYSYVKIAKDLNNKKVEMMIFEGEKERDSLKDLCADVSKIIKNSEYISVKNSGHDLFHQNYQKELFMYIKKYE